MPKNKGHKGLLKRVKVTKTGKVKMPHASSGHLKSGKSPDRLRRLRMMKTASNSEAKRFSRILNKRLRGKDQPRSEIKRSPSPDERRAMQAEKRQAATE